MIIVGIFGDLIIIHQAQDGYQFFVNNLDNLLRWIEGIDNLMAEQHAHELSW